MVKAREKRGLHPDSDLSIVLMPRKCQRWGPGKRLPGGALGKFLETVASLRCSCPYCDQDRSLPGTACPKSHLRVPPGPYSLFTWSPREDTPQQQARILVSSKEPLDP